MKEGGYIDNQDPTNYFKLTDNSRIGASLAFDVAAHDSDTNREPVNIYLEGVCLQYVIMRMEFIDHSRSRTMRRYVGFHRDTGYKGQPDNGHVRMTDMTAERVHELLRNPVDSVTGNITRHSTIKRTRRGKHEN